MERDRIAIIIPAFNEESTIRQIIAEAGKYGTPIVVDDNSSDRTPSIVLDTEAILVRNYVNLGYEATLNRGFEEALTMAMEIMITMDADGEHSPSLLPDFIKHFVQNDAELVLGVRPKKQRFSENLMGFYTRVFYGAGDILCGFKGYHVKLVEQNFGFDHSNSVGTELALNSIKKKCVFVEVPVYGFPRKDTPRFDGILRANYRILKALTNRIRWDLRDLFAKF